MILKATYDSKPCYVNADYIVDVFQNNFATYTAYTLDNEREGYTITKEEFEKWLNFKNEDVQKVSVIK